MVVEVYVKDKNMNNDNIKYIIKFFKKKEYAEQFLNEKIIYANPVGYFWSLEEGQGDKTEASAIYNPLEQIHSEIRVNDIKNGEGYPIFCSYCVKDEDVKDNNIIDIDARCISDFFSIDGIAVVYEMKNFLEIINSCDKVLTHGVVVYKDDNLSFEDEVNYLSGNGLSCIIKKKKQFSYQKEYRVVFDDWIKGNIVPYERGVRMVYNDNQANRYNYYSEAEPIGVFKKSDFIDMNNGKFLLEI